MYGSDFDLGSSYACALVASGCGWDSAAGRTHGRVEIVSERANWENGAGGAAEDCGYPEDACHGENMRVSDVCEEQENEDGEERLRDAAAASESLGGGHGGEYEIRSGEVGGSVSGTGEQGQEISSWMCYD